MAKTKTTNTKSAPQPAAPPPPGTVAHLLSTLDSIQDGQTVDEYTQHLAITGVTAQVNANAYRLKLGLELLASAPKPREGRTEWEAQQADRLGVKPRQFRNILGAARGVRLLATEMPIAVLDRPLTRLVAAAKAIKNGGDPDAVADRKSIQKTADERWVAAVKRVQAVLADLPPDARLERLLELEAQIKEQLALAAA